MTPINEEAGLYHSPRGVDVFASINAAISQLGGTPIEAPTFERFARAPGGVQLLDALAELETSAGLEPTVVEQGRFFRSPRASDTFDRLNAVIVALGGDPIDYGAGVSGNEVVAVLEELSTGAESGGTLDPDFLVTQYAGPDAPMVGFLGAMKVFDPVAVSWNRPNNTTQYSVGDHFGPPIHLANFAPAGRLVNIGWRASFNPRPLNMPSLDMLFFSAKPSGFDAGVDNGNVTIDLADRALMLSWQRRNSGDWLGNDGFQPAVGAGRTLQPIPVGTFRGVLPTGDLWVIPGIFNSAYTPAALTNILWHFHASLQ